MKAFSVFLVLVGLAAFSGVNAQNSCPSFGPVFESKGLTKVGELNYTEVMAPSSPLPQYIYWSSINFQVGPRGGYCGIQNPPAGNGARNCIFSIWDLVDDDNSHECYAEYAVPGSIVEGFGNEGTGIHGIFHMNWTPNYWYGTTVRRWYTGDGKTRVGFFMYDYSTGKWYHYFTFVTPEADAKMNSNSFAGFLENFGASANNSATSVGYYRNSWSMDGSGQFSKPTHYIASAGPGYWKAEAVNNNTEVKITSCGPGAAPTPYPAYNTFYLNQNGSKPPPATPAVVTSVAPTYANGYVTVNWVTSAYASPQLSYTVKIHGSGGLYTPALATVQGIRPDTRSITAALPANSPTGTYWVSVELKDIFNQTSNLGYASVNVNSVPTGGISTNIYYKIRNVFSGQYLDVEGGSVENSAYITQQYSGSATSQHWRFQKVGAKYLIINRKSNKPITIPWNVDNQGSQLIQYVISNTPSTQYNQQWALIPQSPAGYYIKTAMSSGRIMCNPGYTNVNGARMILWSPNVPETSNELWVLEPVSNTLSAQAEHPLLVSEAKTGEQIQVYPNPVERGKALRFNLPPSDNAYQLVVRTLSGAEVLKVALSSSNAEISTKNFVPGIYLFQISGTENSFKGKFVAK